MPSQSFRNVAVIPGGDAFMRPLDERRRARIAQQIAALERGDLRAMAKPFAALFRSPILMTIARFARPRISDPAFVAHMLRLENPRAVREAVTEILRASSERASPDA